MNEPLLRQKALATRKLYLKMHFEAHAGHIGTGLSCIDILTYLYSDFLKNPGTPEGDFFVLSKGHGASALYATLRNCGLMTEEELATYYKDGTLLPAHPAAGAHRTIPAATGSLGHGLPISCGVAYANKNFNRRAPRVVCLMSDGECDEGTTWEAGLFAAHHRLDALTVIIDANGLQGFGKTSAVLNTEPLPAKWEALGFEVREIDGHDFGQLASAVTAPRIGKPRCVIARTHKGKGVSFMEDRMEWHYLPMTEAQYRQALAELEQVKP